MLKARWWVVLGAVAAFAWVGCGGSDGELASTSQAGGKDGGNGDGEVPCTCWVTGGGFVFLNGQRVTFGFNALKEPPGGQHIEIQFHGEDNYFGRVEELVSCELLEDESVAVTFTGTLFENSPSGDDLGDFTVTVVDAGEPGSNLPGGGPDLIEFTSSVETLSEGLSGGNVQVHQLQCEE